MTLTDAQRKESQDRLGPAYDADKYAMQWGGYEEAIASMGVLPPGQKKVAKKKTAKKKAKKK